MVDLERNNCKHGPAQHAFDFVVRAHTIRGEALSFTRYRSTEAYSSTVYGGYFPDQSRSFASCCETAVVVLITYKLFFFFYVSQ